MFWTIAVVLALWCIAVLFAITLMLGASRADEDMARQAWFEGRVRHPTRPSEYPDDLWLA